MSTPTKLVRHCPVLQCPPLPHHPFCPVPQCPVLQFQRPRSFATRLSEDTLALQCHVNLSLGCTSDRSWRHRPGRPRKRKQDQLRTDNIIHPLICGNVPSHAVIGEWRYGYYWLCVDDDVVLEVSGDGKVRHIKPAHLPLITPQYSITYLYILTGIQNVIYSSSVFLYSLSYSPSIRVANYSDSTVVMNIFGC